MLRIGLFAWQKIPSIISDFLEVIGKVCQFLFLYKSIGLQNPHIGLLCCGFVALPCTKIAQLSLILWGGDVWAMAISN